MTGFLKTIGGLLKYNEPENEDMGFELLEEQTEGQDSDQKQDTSPQEGSGRLKEPREKGSDKKTPLTVEEWNEARNREDPCRPEENRDILSEQLCVNLEAVKRMFNVPKNRDILIREFKIARKMDAFLVFIDGMADKETLNRVILPELMSKENFADMGDQRPVDYISKNVLTVHQVIPLKNYESVKNQVLSGLSALFIEGCSECIVMETRGYEKRNVEQPITERVVKGSQEGFSENLRTNLTLIRRIIKNENLITEMLPVGKTNNANCAVLYMQGIANPKVVNEVKRRIKRIDTDIILGDGMLEQYIEDTSFMLFPQMLNTERPDRAASFLSEGQVVIITEGAPFALAVPVSFFRLFHTSEDAFLRWPYGSFLRLVRMFGLFCATLLPGLYVAVILYHQEMIPTELLASLAKAKESVPFPTVLELLLLDLSFELIREAGIRVPGVIGQTLGIIGALILGQAAVAASLVSPILIIVIAVTGLGNFAIPNYALALSIRIERFLFIIAGAALGFYGITVLVFLLGCIACGMKSFGVPFFVPVAPRTTVNPDVILRAPIWAQKNRPDPMNTPDRKRQGNNPQSWISNTPEKKRKGRRDS